MSTTDLGGHEDIEVDATLNGKPLRRRVKARQHLADFLRQDLIQKQSALQVIDNEIRRNQALMNRR